MTRRRVAVSLAVAALACCCFLGRALLQDDPLGTGADLHHTVVGAKLLFAGENIFRTHPTVPDAITGGFSTGDYPLPAYLLVYPLSLLQPMVASCVFVFLTTFGVAYLLTARGWEPLIILASYPAVKAFILAQWSPLVLCAALTPLAAPLVLCKPNVGLSILAAFPDRRRLLACAAVFALSVAFMPTWPWDWFQGLPAVRGLWHQTGSGVLNTFDVAVLLPGGFVLLLAAWRLRDWRARLLLTHALLPQTMSFDDQLPLALTAQTARRRLVWVGLSWVGAALWLAARTFADGPAEKELRNAACLLTAWLPALWSVMRPVADDATTPTAPDPPAPHSAHPTAPARPAAE